MYSSSEIFRNIFVIYYGPMDFRFTVSHWISSQTDVRNGARRNYELIYDYRAKYLAFSYHPFWLSSIVGKYNNWYKYKHSTNNTCDLVIIY